MQHLFKSASRSAAQFDRRRRSREVLMAAQAFALAGDETSLSGVRGMSTVLVIDDDRTVLQLVEKALREKGVQLHTASNAQEGLEALAKHVPDVLLLDIMLPDGSGLDLVTQVRALEPKLPVAFITVADDSHTAIEAMKRGAYDFLVKPLSVDDVQQVVLRAIETRRLMEVPVKIPEPDEPLGEFNHHDVMLGRSPSMMEVYKDIGRIASQDVAVLICGESGTGKELVARAIYQHSSRGGQCFLAVNCAAITDTLLESELFGHEKGAFTGADRRRIGKFEQCNGGTIFLDEVGDMSPATQSKVLRLLQDQQFERVGGSETIETDVRIISATNRDLEQMIDDGRFRADLYHRLHGYRIDLPPLRERGDDLLLLIGYFLNKFHKELGKDVEGMSPAAMEVLTRYTWPGNVRELQTVLRTAVLKTSGPVIAAEVLPDLTEPPKIAPAGGNGEAAADSLEAFVEDRQRAGSHNLYAEALQRMELYLVTRVLRETGGNQSQAADRLGITRGSLRNKIRALGISIGHVVEPGEP
jgi:two-component system nitrogen regulation response regulator GlnG